MIILALLESFHSNSFQKVQESKSKHHSIQFSGVFAPFYFSLSLTLSLLASSPGYAHPIPVGSEEMMQLFSDLGIRYERALSFAKVFSPERVCTTSNSSDEDAGGGTSASGSNCSSTPSGKPALEMNPNLPGSLLVITQTLPSGEKDPRFHELMSDRKLLRKRAIPERLEASLRKIDLIQGYGLYADRVFEKGEMIGLYSGEAVYVEGAKRIGMPAWLKFQLDSEPNPEMVKQLLKQALYGQSVLHPDFGKSLNPYELTLVESLPFMKSDPVFIDARMTGNETRFINHGWGGKENCVFKPGWMRYSEFLELSGISSAEATEKLPTALMPVGYVEVNRRVEKDQQFLVNYGESYWANMLEKHGIMPVDLSEL